MCYQRNNALVTWPASKIPILFWTAKVRVRVNHASYGPWSNTQGVCMRTCSGSKLMVAAWSVDACANGLITDNVTSKLKIVPGWAHKNQSCHVIILGERFSETLTKDTPRTYHLQIQINYRWKTDINLKSKKNTYILPGVPLGLV